MRRLLPLLTLLLLALPANAAAALPKVPALADDATAMRTLSQAAVKVERCGARTFSYIACDTRAELPLARGVLFEASMERGYALVTRSRQGRRFTLERSGEVVNATCTPAGRGRCGGAGTWTPKPRPVMSPAWAKRWLAHERELVARILTVAELIDRCHTTTGDYTQCRTPEVQAAATPFPHTFVIDLFEGWYSIHTISPAPTEFLYQRLPDGSTYRGCRFYPSEKLVSPCDGEGW